MLSLFKQTGSTETLSQCSGAPPQKSKADLEKYNRAAAVAAEEMCVLQGRLGFAIDLGTWIRAYSPLLMMSAFEYCFTVFLPADAPERLCKHAHHVNFFAAMVYDRTPLILDFRRSSETLAWFPETICGYRIQHTQPYLGDDGKQSYDILNLQREKSTIFAD